MSNVIKHQSFITRWTEARMMYMQGAAIKEIADKYGKTVKSMSAFILKNRKSHGWFMFRIENLTIKSNW